MPRYNHRRNSSFESNDKYKQTSISDFFKSTRLSTSTVTQYLMNKENSDIDDSFASVINNNSDLQSRRPTEKLQDSSLETAHLQNIIFNKSSSVITGKNKMRKSKTPKKTTDENEKTVTSTILPFDLPSYKPSDISLLESKITPSKTQKKVVQDCNKNFIHSSNCVCSMNNILPYNLPSYMPTNILSVNSKSKIGLLAKQKKTATDNCDSEDEFLPSPKRSCLKRTILPFNLPSYKPINVELELHDTSFTTVHSPNVTLNSSSLSSGRNKINEENSRSKQHSKLSCKKQLFDSSKKTKYVSVFKTNSTFALENKSQSGNTTILNSSFENIIPKETSSNLQNDITVNSNKISKEASTSFNKSASFSSTSSNETIICNDNFNFDITENEPYLITNSNVHGHSTPKRPITILSNIVCRTSSQKLSTEVSPQKSPRKSTKLTIKLHRNQSPKKYNSPKKLLLKNENENEDTWSGMAMMLFSKITKFIFSHKHLATLFTKEETDYLNKFLKISADKYKLFCFKLFMRQRKWQNIFKFTELLKLEMSPADVKNMYDELLKNNFIHSDMFSDSLVNLLHTLLVKDIKDVCRIFKIKTDTLKKETLIEKLLKQCNIQTTLTLANTEQVLKREIIKKMGICVKLNDEFDYILKKLHFLYSFTSNDFEKVGDIYWFLSQIERKDIFMPTYSIDQEVTVFSNIKEFSEFFEAFNCRRNIESCFANKLFLEMLDICEMVYTKLKEYDDSIEIIEASKPEHFKRFTARAKYISALSLGTKYLAQHYPEKVKEFLLYLINKSGICQHMRGKWYDSLIKVEYYYLKQHEEAALKLLIALKDSNLSDIDLQTLSYKGELIKTRKTNPLPELVKNQISYVQKVLLEDFPCVEINSQTTHTNTTGGKRLYIKKDEEQTSILTVEKVALDYYQTMGYPNGIHCEGRLLNMLVFILFWDIIYDSTVKGAFVLETQYYPLDLNTPHFYTNRQRAIDQRLQEVKTDWPLGQLESFMLDMWEKHSHKYTLANSAFILDATDLYEMILCIGRVKVANILERIIKNYRLYHSGLPDLFLWNTNTRKSKFVEVKGERDRLSDKQRVWLNFLRSVGCDIEVCHVHTIGSKYIAKAIKKLIESSSKVE